MQRHLILKTQREPREKPPKLQIQFEYWHNRYQTPSEENVLTQVRVIIIQSVSVWLHFYFAYCESVLEKNIIKMVGKDQKLLFFVYSPNSWGIESAVEHLYRTMGPKLRYSLRENSEYLFKVRQTCRKLLSHPAQQAYKWFPSFSGNPRLTRF